MIPASALETAVRSGNEYAWAKEQVEPAIHALLKAGLAVVSGEFWFENDGRITGLIPVTDGSPEVFHWTAPHRQRGENWDEYLQRTGEHSLAAVRRLEISPSRLGRPGRILYNLTWESEFRDGQGDELGDSPADGG